MSDSSRPRKPGNDFSRLHPVVQDDDLPRVTEVTTDQQGRRALFSGEGTPPSTTGASTGAVVVDCGDCGERTVLTAGAALQHVVPSVHLPFIKRDHGSWMRCPACRRRTWVSVQIQL
ncbi:MAG: hypothetical protein WAN48_08555 [Actinomycetes bacterium]